jgi:hypothetical protein
VCVGALALLGVTVVLTGCQTYPSGTDDHPVPSSQAPTTDASTAATTDGSSSPTTPSPGTNGLTAQSDPSDSSQEDAPLLDLATVVEQVINGDWGSGQDRIDALTNAGYDAKTVQDMVDERLRAMEAHSQTTTSDTSAGSSQSYSSDSGQSYASDSSQTSSGSSVTWHDQVTEPIYENQPVYKWNYTYTITKYMSEKIGKTIAYTSGYTFTTQDIALAEAQTNAQAALTKEIPSATLAKSDYNATSSRKQTGTKRVQTGTRVVQEAGWY